MFQLKFAIQKYNTKKSRLFKYELVSAFRNKTVSNEVLVLYIIGYAHRRIV